MYVQQCMCAVLCCAVLYVCVAGLTCICMHLCCMCVSRKREGRGGGFKGMRACASKPAHASASASAKGV